MWTTGSQICSCFVLRVIDDHPCSCLLRLTSDRLVLVGFNITIISKMFNSETGYDGVPTTATTGALNSRADFEGIITTTNPGTCHLSSQLVV